MESDKKPRLPTKEEKDELISYYICQNDFMFDYIAEEFAHKSFIAVFDNYESYQNVDYDTGKFSPKGKPYKGRIMVVLMWTVPEFSETFIWNEHGIQRIGQEE